MAWTSDNGVDLTVEVSAARQSRLQKGVQHPAIIVDRDDGAGRTVEAEQVMPVTVERDPVVRYVPFGPQGKAAQDLINRPKTVDEAPALTSDVDVVCSIILLSDGLEKLPMFTGEPHVLPTQRLAAQLRRQEGIP